MHQQTTKTHEKVLDVQPRPFSHQTEKKLTVTIAIKNDYIYLKHPGWTSSTDPDQTLWNVVSDQGLYWSLSDCSVKFCLEKKENKYHPTALELKMDLPNW